MTSGLHMERQASATPTKVDMSSTNAGVPLYPNWIARDKTKPAGCDAPRPYQMPKEDTGNSLTLEEELDAAYIFDPLKPDSQSSQPDTQGCSALDSTLGAEGPRTLPHYSEVPAMIPSFDLAQMGIPPQDVAHHRPRGRAPELGAGVPNHMHRPTRTQPGSQQVGAQLVLQKPHVVRVSSWDGESHTCLESVHPPGYARDLQQQKRATCTQCWGGDGCHGRWCQRGEGWRLKMDKTRSPGQCTPCLVHRRVEPEDQTNS